MTALELTHKNTHTMLDELKGKAAEILNNEKVKETVDKAKDFINSEEGKAKLEEAKEKAEKFVEEKTHGKGIFGFGAKD